MLWLLLCTLVALDHNAPLFRTKFILTHTHHPGNVGAAARAMKTMGFDELILVSPRDPKVLNRKRTKDGASGAVNILQRAIVVSTLEEALKDCNVRCGTGMPVDMTLERGDQMYVAPRVFFQDLVNKSSHQQHETVAFVFGNERVGMTKEDFALCEVILGIPTNPEFGSLNLAAAVQLIAYDWRIALGGFDQRSHE